MLSRYATFLAVLVMAALFTDAAEPGAIKAQNLILITTDGFRWQEIFGGADSTLLNKEFGGVRNLDSVKHQFQRETPAERRAALMPFLWGMLVKQGQLFGDPSRGSAVEITNRRYFSYPGYNELLAGFADPMIDSNEKKPNANLNVLEFLNSRERFKGKIVAWTGWDVFPYILNTQRSKLSVWPGDVPPFDQPLNERQKTVNDLFNRMPRVWKDVCFDVFCFEGAREAMLSSKPRVIYVALGETDDWAHDRRYDCYLEAAHRVDDSIRQLWDLAQSIEQYRDKTALLISTDHGRGDNQKTWTSHGEKLPAAGTVWIGVMGPDTPAMGVRENTPATQSQFAATAAHLLGEDFNAASPDAAKPLPGVR